MKKYFILFGLLFVFKLDVSAYSCYYDYSIDETSGGSSGEIELIIDEEKKTIKREAGFGNYDDYLLDPLLDSYWTEEKLIDEYIAGACPELIYGCEVIEEYTNSSGERTTTNPRYFPLLNGNLIELIPKGKKFLSEISDNDNKGSDLDYTLNGDKECIGAALNESKSEKASKELEFPCDKFDNLYSELESLYCDKTTEVCHATQITDYNTKKDILKSYCRTKLKKSVYQDLCVQQCLEISEYIAEIEGTVSSDLTCNFSKRLVLYIANIVKWLKYIIPVIVIILGILDFIKAIASDKDDEMKKAQGRFTKRLVAAALIFIIPIIISFIMDLMGFDDYIYGCEIFDL